MEKIAVHSREQKEQASRIIPDVYAVRKDYFDANRTKVQSFVKALLQAEESLRGLVAGDRKAASYRKSRR